MLALQMLPPKTACFGQKPHQLQTGAIVCQPEPMPFGKGLCRLAVGWSLKSLPTEEWQYNSLEWYKSDAVLSK